MLEEKMSTETTGIASYVIFQSAKKVAKMIYATYSEGSLVITPTIW